MDCRKERKSTNVIPMLYLCYAGSGDSRLLAWQFNITNITLSLCQSQVNAKLLWWIFSVGCLYYTYILTYILYCFLPKVAIRNNHYLQALHLTNYNTKLSVNYNASLIANYNIFKLNYQAFTKLSKSWFLWRRFKTWTDWLNLREGSRLFQSLIVP